MKVKLILPALTEARSPYFRAVKYSLFPPLGLATLAGYLGEGDEIVLQDEHVQRLRLDDDPDLVIIETYITAARRAYWIADRYRQRGAHVCLGGLHPTSLPDEAALHADTVFLGPGEDTFPRFLEDFRNGRPLPLYRSTVRCLQDAPAPRRDLFKRHLYLVPNTAVLTRGCPHRCDFCFKEAFFRGGRSFYSRPVDAVLGEIAAMPGKHVYFLDNHLFGDHGLVEALLDGLRGMNRVWQAGGTVAAALADGLMEKAADAGLRSLFIGFETLGEGNLQSVGKSQNLHLDYDLAIRRLHDLGIMVNGSFIFGLDDDAPDVFDRTVAWAIERGIETATFHILTPYPGTVLWDRMAAQGRILTRDWNLYDTRHAVFRPGRMSVEELEAGYWKAYRDFYRWSSIASAAMTKPTLPTALRHLMYTGGWKKIEWLWDIVIRSGMLGRMVPLLEGILGGFGASMEPGRSRNPARLPGNVVC